MGGIIVTAKPIMGLLFGETAGIGPELIVKALQDDEVKKKATWVLIGDERVLKLGLQIANVHLEYSKIKSVDLVDLSQEKIYLIDLENMDPNSIKLGEVSAVSGKITGETLAYATQLANEKKLDGVVYAPLNKDALYKGGYYFEDDIHLLASLLNCEDGFGEVNVMDDLWVTRVTSHISLKEVAPLITKDRIKERIAFANRMLKSAGFTSPTIAVCALNPHGGDGGLLGSEEIEEIIPAVEEAKEEGFNVEGPYPSDTIFLRLRKDKPFNCLLAMYHDQAQTGMKLMGFNRGVTISGGLPVVLATPAHGTAFDIAGKGLADPGAMMHAMKLALKMLENKEKANI